MKVRIILLGLLLLMQNLTFGQGFVDSKYYLVDSLDFSEISARDKTLVDSILVLFHECNTDTCRMNAVGAIVEESWDDNVWPRYNQWLYDFSHEKLKSEKDSAVLFELKKTKANALNNKGYLHNSRGEDDKALDYYNRTLEIQKQIDDKAGLAGTYINLSSILLKNGLVQQALEYYYSSLRLEEETGNNVGIARALNGIGYIYYLQNDEQKAKEHYDKSLKIRQELGDKYGIATCLNNIGLLYRDKGEWDEALEYYNKCLKLEKELVDKNGIAISLGNIGFIYKEKGDLEKALIHYFESLSLKETLGDERGVSQALKNVADVMLQKNNLNQAHKYALQNMQLANKLGYPSTIRDAAETMANLSKKENNWRDAYKYQGLYAQMKDSVFNKETLESSIQQQYKYVYDKKALADSVRNAQAQEFQKAETERLQLLADKRQQRSYLLVAGLLLALLSIALIYGRFKVVRRQKWEIQAQKDKVEEEKRKNDLYTKNIEQQKEELEHLNQDLQQFASSISHDLRAPLRGISGLVSMILEDNPDIDAEMKELLDLIKDRSIKSHEMVEGILAYSKAGRDAQEVSVVDVAELVQKLVDETSNTNQVKITVTGDFPTITCNRYQLEQVFSNLINNAIKYNHREKGLGEVAISVEQSPKFYEFSVVDNGPGIPERMRESVFDIFKKAHSSGHPESSGIGLSIVKKLVARNGGKVILNSKLGEGSTFKFTIPK